MSKISLKRGVVLFVVVFVLLAIVALVALPQPTLWQSVSIFFSTIIVAGVVIHAYNQREEIKHLESEVERAKYRASSGENNG